MASSLRKLLEALSRREDELRKGGARLRTPSPQRARHLEFETPSQGKRQRLDREVYRVQSGEKLLEHHRPSFVPTAEAAAAAGCAPQKHARPPALRKA
eukprot:CAMPEP_0115723010 /NCGR_PEP_ID=MMETSP0272-20121206/80003_1 /TAXON_ID=71861 /ORGANISM="Scrippsiella trochoidea, Strain CCMP3099" /LENGTH=97 /DNA_ID=CAMNT_0003166111 /DNA_START=54 /DNA_END=343 /DNA_ORIENTATION=-